MIPRYPSHLTHSKQARWTKNYFLDSTFKKLKPARAFEAFPKIGSRLLISIRSLTTVKLLALSLSAGRWRDRKAGDLETSAEPQNVCRAQGLPQRSSTSVFSRARDRGVKDSNKTKITQTLFPCNHSKWRRREWEKNPDTGITSTRDLVLRNVIRRWWHERVPHWPQGFQHPGIRQGSFPSPPGGHTAHPRGPPVLARVRHETHRESPEWPGDTEQPSTADSRAQPGRRAPHTNLGPPNASPQTQWVTKTGSRSAPHLPGPHCASWSSLGTREDSASRFSNLWPWGSPHPHLSTPTSPPPLTPRSWLSSILEGTDGVTCSGFVFVFLLLVFSSIFVTFSPSFPS